MEKLFYNVEEVGEIFRISPLTVKKFLRNGSLKGVKVGQAWRVSKEDIESFIEQNSNRKGDQ